jgi:hypothetical protein
MRKHWREQHHWVAPANRSGRRKPPGPSVAEQHFQQSTRVVQCQRAFVQGLGSHYIRVQTLGVKGCS